MKALAGSELATQLPALQRFLRSAAVELIAGLKTPSVSAGNLRALFKQHEKAFEEARAEAAKCMGGSGQGGTFWESSV